MWAKEPLWFYKQLDHRRKVGSMSQVKHSSMCGKAILPGLGSPLMWFPKQQGASGGCSGRPSSGRWERFRIVCWFSLGLDSPGSAMMQFDLLHMLCLHYVLRDGGWSHFSHETLYFCNLYTYSRVPWKPSTFSDLPIWKHYHHFYL